MAGAAECIVALLLLIALKLLVGISHQNDIVQAAEIGQLLARAAHIDKAVLETSPMSSYYKNAAVLESVQSTLTGLAKRAGVTREQSCTVKSYSRLDGLLHRAKANLIAGLYDVEIRFCDSLILTDKLESLFLVDGQNAIRKRKRFTEYNVLHIEITNFQLHECNIASFLHIEREYNMSNCTRYIFQARLKLF